MMQLNLSHQNLERIIELLRKNASGRGDQYLISYLEQMKKNCAAIAEINLDDIPF
jgi:hypothetical protein